MRLKYMIVVYIINIFSALNSQAHYPWLNPKFGPAEDDHWKHGLVRKLPPAFIEKLYTANSHTFSEPEGVKDAIEMANEDGEVREKLRENQMGDFVYNEQLLLGTGEEGVVCLAQHIPTRQYLAIKVTARETEFKAFQNLGRCYACFQKGDKYFIYTPLILGTPLSKYVYMEAIEEDLGITVDDKNKIKYNKWPYTIKLLKGYLSELRRCVKYEGIPQELDSKSMFVIHGEQPHFVFVDLDIGKYSKKDSDYIPDDFCRIMNYLLGYQSGGASEKLVFPKPVQKFFNRVYSDERDNSYFIRLTQLEEFLDELDLDMMAIEH